MKKVEKVKTVGILGGGQLGRKLVEACSRRGLKTIVLCPPGDNPAMDVATKRLVSPYDHEGNLSTFAKEADVITYEFENVPLQTVRYLEGLVSVYPQSNILEVSQDRYLEKSFARKNRVPIPDFEFFNSHPTIHTTRRRLLPGFLKTVRGGYDGKGQRKVLPDESAVLKWQELGVPCILEKAVDFECEISVIVCRDREGNTACYPPIENVHKHGILHKSFYPIRVDAEGIRRSFDPESVRTKAEDLALKLAIELNLVGILAVEMFVLADGTVLFNEMAPRPHNSGHLTIEACYSSQYDQLARILVRDPLGSTEFHSEAQMINLLGEDILQIKKYLRMSNATVHVYGKEEIKPGRKMGHVTITGAHSFAA